MIRKISLLRLFLFSAAVLGAPLLTSAQSSSPNNPTMAGARMDSDRDGLYAQFNDYRRSPNPEQQRYAYPTAKEYLRRWGGEDTPEVREVRKWFNEYERQMHQAELYAAYNAKDYAKTFTLARPLVKADPENFFALGIMTEAGYDNALAGNTELHAETIASARQAIALLEAKKVTRADPFNNVGVAYSFLNYALATMVRDHDPLTAAAAYSKALKSPDSPYHSDPIAYHRLGVAIYKGELAQLSTEYNQKFGGKQTSPEQTAMFNRVLHLADRAIDAYARAVALLDKPEQKNARAQALTQLTAIYKSFHNNSDEGLNELIAGVLSKPMP